MGEDPIGFTSGDTNFYRYVGNSPINFIDPSGKFGVAGAFAGAVVGVISSFISPCGDFGFQGWISLGLNVGVGAALGAVGAGFSTRTVAGTIGGLGTSMVSAGINYGLSSSCRDKPSCE